MVFNEIYGRYYKIFDHLLEQAHQAPLSKADIKGIIQKYGYEESVLHLYPKVIPGEDAYDLLIEKGQGYTSILKSEPVAVMTDLEKRWLKTVFEDRRMVLFFDPEHIEVLKESLKESQPLIDANHYIYKGVANDGDDYSNKAYQKHFRIIQQGIQEQKGLFIQFENAEGKPCSGFYMPYRIEYSVKDDKFRLTGVGLKQGKMNRFHRINLNRITSVRMLKDSTVSEDLVTFIHSKKMRTPITIEIRNVRNGFERCFIQLSHYERNTEYDEVTGVCTMKLYYYDFDEPELIITLLSFGPAVKVLDPPHVVANIKERLGRQIQMLTLKPNHPCDLNT